jgi:bacitracin transport system ATP-binding protein
MIEYLTEQEVLNMDTNYIIETKNLTKQYGSQKSVADLNIHVKRGRIYGLLGRNGAGKTTTMKMLLGLTKPTSGEVKIWGTSLQGNEKNAEKPIDGRTKQGKGLHHE